MSDSNMVFTSDNIIAITCIFTEDNGNTLSEYDASLVKNSGLCQFSPDELEKMLINSIIDNTHNHSTYWALGKRYNIDLLCKFRDWLSKELELNNAINVYQLLIALDNLEEPVFSKNRVVFSVDDESENIYDAKLYLKHITSQSSRT